MKKEKIVILAPFPIYPPDNAGANRIFSLSMELSKYYDVVNYSQCVNRSMIWKKLSGKPSFAKVIVNNYYKIIQSYNPIYNFFLFLTSRINAQNFLASTALNLHQDKVLMNEIQGASLLQVEHPWQYDWAKKISEKYNIPLVLSIHNIESNILKDAIPAFPLKKLLINYLFQKENRSYKIAKNIIYLSENEKRYFEDTCDDKKNSCIIPMWPDNRLFSIERLFTNKNKIINIFFVGSNWMPNIIAMRFIEKLAEKNINNRKLIFLIAGSVGQGRKKSKNIIYTGKLKSLMPIYEKADIFINPMSIGSGVNFKVIEAMAASLPIITTPFGARGIKLKNNINGIIADLSEFNNVLNQLANNKELRIKIGKAARVTALKYYQRKNVIDNIKRFYNEL